ncbi:ABC transporter substrate-binding protein [Breznakiella homolactica]|uniref:Peptide ABC transporter substrate-binding protein n=1 Tax=Breznakiella homolactica TaxID=2798577 RepID=A0A7T7XNE5_9SPIR|nr:ABC transporter substrate-binding protein [Breznakiella homolactica]QQO09541.1 peptide ABC transporter substrate-binding protein [Breznakiella homolactica]
MKKLCLSVLLAALSVCVFAGGGSDKAGGTGAVNSNPLSDPQVRQAIAYAIDMDTICRTLLLDKAVPANSLTPNGEWKVSGLNNYTYNPSKAMELLKAAKWDPNYTLDVGYYYDDQQTVDLMVAVQAYLEAVGIKANFRRIQGDFNTLLWMPPKDPVNGPSAVDWDVLYGATAALVLHEYYNKYIGGSAGNSHTPTDPQLDTLIAATNATADVAKQKAAFNELQKYENENLFAIPLYYQPLFIFCRDTVTRTGDTNGNAQYNYDWNIINWDVKPDASGKKVLKTNAGPVQFFEHPWFNPGVYIGSKVLFDRLIVADGSLAPKEGALASSYTVSPDNMTLTFTMRNNIKWHDGKPITPQDVKWSIEYALKVPAIHAVFASTFNAIDGAAEFKAGSAQDVRGIQINGNTITIKFAALDPNMLMTFSQFAPLPQSYFIGTDPAQFQQNAYWQKPVGSGPFMVREAKMNDYAVFVPFRDYYKGVAKIDEIRSYPSGENDANLVINANANNLDYGYTKNSNDAIALEKVSGMKVFPVNMFYTRLFFVNKFPKK